MYFNASLPLISEQNNYRGSHVKPCGRLGKWIGNGFKLSFWSKRGYFAPQGVSFLRRTTGLKEAIKGLCNGISNVSLPLKNGGKNICFAFFTPLLLICLLKLSQRVPWFQCAHIFFVRKKGYFTSDFILINISPPNQDCVCQKHRARWSEKSALCIPVGYYLFPLRHVDILQWHCVYFLPHFCQKDRFNK